MRRLPLALLLTVSLALVIAGGAAGADEPAENPVDPALCEDGTEGAPAPAYCGDDVPEVAAATLAAPSTTSAECTRRVDIVFWTANRWRPLMRALAANPAACADYYISIPPDENNLVLRPGSVFREVRDLSPQFHSVAEMRLGGGTAWAQWVAAGNGTWYEAGVEFRRRMAVRNLRPELGHTWLLNEFDYTTRRDQAVHTDGDPGYPRAAMRELVRGLYEGAPGMAPGPGIVEIGISQSHQNLPDVPAYKEQMKAWLQDGGFWAAMDGKIGWLAHEVYADTRRHGVPGSRLEDRRRHLVDYQEHLLELVKAGGRRALHARAFFKETFMPFANGGGYVALGGDPTFESGHGNTEVPLDQMMKFVAEQVNAVEFYAERHFDAQATRRIGFSWQPVNRPRSPGGPDVPSAEFEAAVEVQAAHIAAVLAATYGPGASSKSACLRETGTDWCTMQRPDAFFTDAWELFSVW
jgi:hypothetical protein